MRIQNAKKLTHTDLGATSEKSNERLALREEKVTAGWAVVERSVLAPARRVAGETPQTPAPKKVSSCSTCFLCYKVLRKPKENVNESVSLHRPGRLLSCEMQRNQDDPIQCFKCDTLTESRCVDPFNYSTTYHLLEDCPGCCVKIIENMGSVDSRIRRTCTEQLEVNLFMVDHVCMTDAKGKGKMCFCETDMCNAAKTATLAASERLTALISSILSLLVVYLVGKCEQQR
ncbi:unnamed protein product [Cyprideis torosa]|uniref:UPAR/Ly6 domain-containing protein qvr n=1 Tax=Cyprideis torosa TaxID=163714 RepID=A0A7R8W2W3_9CRUS|nr:unnamed protein product [Cyprideis torosa]CAG0880148.1 unnamed protein product [Cyprideis torosa]